MQLGYIGLGKMGKNMALRLVEKGHELVVWNRSEEPREELAAAGATAADTVSELVSKLGKHKVVWVMLPAGEITQNVIDELVTLLSEGDIVINGANEYYKTTRKHADQLTANGIRFLDAGVSGGPAGARDGACVMIGGDQSAFEELEQLFVDISAPDAYQFFPGNGAGHFVKMVHNGIEYGMMQAIAEGFDVLKQSDFDINLAKAATIYNNRSVIESRLVGWTLSGYQEYGIELADISGSAGSGGAAGIEKSEAKWTVDVAKEQGVPAKVIEDSVNFRVESQEKPSYQGRVINMIRNQFGGHSTK